MNTSHHSLLRKITTAAIVMLAGIGAAQAGPSTTIVISQVYGGGGNSGATYKNDFVELHNISNTAVVVDGWSVQYASSTGSSWQVTNISGTIQPGAYYLVQESAGSGGTTNLPTPDATGSINMSATAGKVVLCNNITAQTVTNPTNSAVVDFVGFGTATTYEGSGAAPAPSNTTSDTRLNNGSTDTNNNAADFGSAAGTVTPHNSASTIYRPIAKVAPETAADGSGATIVLQTVGVGNSLTAYAITRSTTGTFAANTAATWSLTNETGGIVDSDLVPSGDSKSAVFTPHAEGSAVIHVAINQLDSVDSGVITAMQSTPPSAVASVDAQTATDGQTITITVTVTPGTNPASSGLTVVGDLSAIGGSSTQAFTAGPNNTFTYQTTIPATLAGGVDNLTFSVSDAQSRNVSTNLNETIRGNLVIFHTNDTHARVTPHKWIVPSHTSGTTPVFEDVGGIAYMGAKVLSLTTAQPDALVLDGGDVSEGNPVGDWNGPGNATGSYGDGTIVDYFKMLDTKLKAIPGRGGRGLDAMVVGNHDIRDTTYFQNMLAASSQFPVLSINICNKGTHTPYYKPYTIVNVNGNKIGIVGYTTEASDSPESAVNNMIDVVKCDWSSSDSTKIHFKDIVNDLRTNQGCNMVILLTHMGHSGLCTVTSDNPTPILVDDGTVKLPEIAVTGHWHTYSDTIWQPTSLNYKTIFTEAGSFQHYVGELRVDGLGKYMSSTYYPLRNSAITPDPDIASYLDNRKTQYAAATPTPPYGLDQVIGYTASDLLLDNYMKWWSADEYPWSGNNTAGNWICDAMQWKATSLFGQCDLSIESGGGVRSDIVTGPVTYTNIYETFPWPDDTLYVVNMTGQEINNYFQQHGCDVALSSNWHVTAYDGNPTEITYNGQPIDMSKTYKVAINSYMYLHDTVPFSDQNPQTSTYLARTALVDYTSQFGQNNPYNAGPSRYTLNTDFSGGYRAVVTMMNDADSSTSFDDGFIRFLSALPETLGHRGTPQVPTDLVNADGTMNRANRLVENEWYRSYLGFRAGVLKPGDIVEIWGKGSFYQGDPEFVDSEGVQSDGVEFKIVGHDDSLALPTYFSSIGGFYDQVHKNHYVKFFAKKTGTSSVTDNNGTTIAVQDVTAYSAKTLPGNVGDLLMLTGVPTSENYALRFRCDNAVLASSVGVTNYPPDSQVAAVTPVQSAAPLALQATAQIAPGSGQNFYTLEPVADAQVISGSADTNSGASTNLFVQSSNAGPYQDERSWLRFDLSSIPAGSTITSAKLNLFCWRTTGASLPTSVNGGNDDTWAEAGITWNNQPTFGTALDTQTLISGLVNNTYAWDVTSYAQTKFTGNKLVSLVVKAVAEDATDSTPPSYGFDSKEYNSNHPYLQVITPATGTPASVSQVQYYYRYSMDNTNWGNWTASQTANFAPWTANFNYPQGEGYYELYSIATDSNGTVEPAPPYGDVSVFFAPSATNIAPDGATLNGTLNPNGADTTIHFEFGTDATYGQSTASTDIGTAGSATPFSLDVSGLQQNTIYHYRLVSVTNGVTTDFPDQTFTTAASVPLAPLWGRIALPVALLLAAASFGLARRKKSA